MKSPAIKCPECNGSGTVKLPVILADTLKVLGRRERIASDIRDFFPEVTVNAINNRLESLRKLGFVQRERRGKFWVYSRVPAPQQPSK